MEIYMKYKFLRIFAVVLSVIISAAGSIHAANVSIDSVKVNHEEKLVTIEGNVGEDTETRVTLRVIKPDGETEDYFGQTDSNADGDYKFKFRVGPDAVEDAQYSVYVYSENSVKKAISGFKCFNEASVSNALNLLNSASGSSIGRIINEKNEIFGLPIGIGSDFYNLERKQPVYDELTGQNFKDLDALRAKFEQAVSNQKQVEYEEKLRSDALASINNASENEMKTVFPPAAELLGINTDTKTVEKLTDAEDEIYSTLALNDYESIEKLKSFYDSLIVVQAIKNANREMVAYVIDEYNHILGCKDNSDYSKMSEVSQAEVRKRLVGIDFKNFDITNSSGIDSAIKKIKDVFKDAVVEVKKKKGSTNSSQSGGGGGGGGGADSAGISSGMVKFPSGNDNSDGETASDGAKFIDIDDVSWAKEGILALAEKNVIAGYGDKTFKPQENVTREQFVKMLVAAFELPYNTKEIYFEDVNTESWYYEYVSSGVGCGVVNGISETKFGVGSNITRQDMAVMAYRTMEYLEIEIPEKTKYTEFADADKISGYASDAVKVMQIGKIINGIGNNEFAPTDSCTRAMAAKVIYELCKLVG